MTSLISKDQTIHFTRNQVPKVPETFVEDSGLFEELNTRLVTVYLGTTACALTAARRSP